MCPDVLNVLRWSVCADPKSAKVGVNRRVCVPRSYCECGDCTLYYLVLWVMLICVF